MNKVKVGFFSFTEITQPDQHVPYNEWHQLDHIPENIALAGIAHGQRWVCPPAYRDARVASEPELDPIQYVTTYLMTDPIEQTLRDFLDLGAQMDAIGGRFHRFRKSHLAGPFGLIKSYVSPRVLVHHEVVPYRPHKGIYVTVADVLDSSQLDEITKWLDTTHIPEFTDIDGVAGTLFYTSDIPRLKIGYDLPPHRLITVSYLDDDPLIVADRMKAHATEASKDRRGPRSFGDSFRLLLASPFQTITPWEWDWFE